MISLYYHSLFVNDRNDSGHTEKLRRLLSYSDFHDIQANLPHFIEWTFETEARSRSPYRFTWSRWAEDWYDRWQVLVRYEDLLLDTRSELTRVLDAFGCTVPEGQVNRAVDKFDFYAVTGRRPGQPDASSFARSGIARAWPGVFSDDARRIFAEVAGHTLVLLGYESDKSWAGPSRA
jgi:hypothetical protein